MLMTLESFGGNLPEPEINRGAIQEMVWYGSCLSLILPGD